MALNIKKRVFCSPESGNIEYETLTVEENSKSVEFLILSEENEFYSKRYRKPEYLLLGWEIYLQLCMELSNFENYCGILKPKEFMGYKIIIDETRNDVIQFIPKFEDVMFGGY